MEDSRRQKKELSKESVRRTPKKQQTKVPGERSGKISAERKEKVTCCPVSERCGGCRWIDRTYEEQLREKERLFRKLIGPYCKEIEPFIRMEEPAHYRNKVHAVFGEDRRHNVISGTYEAKSHRIVPVDSCYIENEKADEIIVSIRNLMKSFHLRPYNEDSGYGLVRHVLLRTGHATGEIMVVLVLASPILPSKNNFVKALLKLHPEITTIVLNVNNRGTSMVLGEKEQVLYGKGYIEDELCGKIFRISPKSFYQVNPVQAEKLYRKALQYAELTGKEIVLDAYCGTGTIGMIASDYAGEVIGVELNPDAVRDAKINAKRNQVKRIQFYQNDAGKFLERMAQEREERGERDTSGHEAERANAAKGKTCKGNPIDVLLMDPPRSGSDEAFLSAAARIKPSKIVYISCNPETLVRDIKYLKKYGYRVERAAGVDMFPFTDSMEAVCSLVRM